MQLNQMRGNCLKHKLMATGRTLSSSLLFMKGLTTLYVVVKYQGWWVTWTALNRAGNESCRRAHRRREGSQWLRFGNKTFSLLYFLSDLQHVHHLLQLRGFDPRGVLHGEALEVLNQDEAVDLSLFVLQQLLQDHTVSSQDLTHTHTHTHT